MKIHDVIKETKYLSFVITALRVKTVVVGVFNNSSHDMIGEISWYGPWRQYTMDPGYGTTWNHQCLKDVAEVLDTLNANHKSKQIP